MKIIENKTFDEERALYGLEDAIVERTVFSGPADGESCLKEARRIKVSDCFFHLRYPLWHVEGLELSSSRMDEGARAALWYTKEARIRDTVLHGIKAVRECDDIDISDCDIVSPEFGWFSKRINLSESSLESEYAFLNSSDIKIEKLDFKGKYSFQYVRNLEIKNSHLSTKDAFWHGRNVTVVDSVIEGEYLGWYSDGLTLINCTIKGTQPFCYCRNLKLVDCIMIDTDLAFEKSEVMATIKGDVLSVKNPEKGCIEADHIGSIILDKPSDCKIVERL